MSYAEPVRGPHLITSTHDTICPSCATVTSRARQISKGLLQAVAWFLSVPVLMTLLALVLGPDTVRENSLFIGVFWVVFGLGFAGKALSDGFNRACTVCGERALVPLVSAEGQRLLAERPKTAVLKGHRGRVNGLAVLSDGRLASGSSDKTVRVWDLTGAGEPVVHAGHTGTVTSLAALPGGRLASGSGDMTVRVWDPTGAGEPVVLTGHTAKVTNVAGLPDGRVVSVDKSGRMRVSDPADPSDPGRWIDTGQGKGVEALAVLPDGRIVTGGPYDTLCVVDPNSDDPPAIHGGHQLPVTGLAALDDGRVVCVEGRDTVRVVDLSGAEPPVELTGIPGYVLKPVVLPGGRVAASAVGDHAAVRIWDLADTSHPLVLKTHAVDLAAVDEDRLATVSGKDIRVWTVARAS